ncbi:hypothetical protein DFA_06611 [Cavenderia fasciculata]|uniref:Galactose-1-phosphate uridylyltransferase n=1 Tax=Cavenderia fasciculata TaxID=261658 RepID=F4PJH5_CACFS|nr:uncharacterized protein DFA_06611 [Cavenderia fasciculata]EGG24461.1 hypothetical protein DFA_06611 [Cavenderia fasciculata]|eukprot:XP_004362312.1 hypothetical protein DFA_06611 [Cavenderia fasciculata]
MNIINHLALSQLPSSRKVLYLYRRVFRLANQWEKESERDSIRDEARDKFHKNMYKAELDYLTYTITITTKGYSIPKNDSHSKQQDETTIDINMTQKEIQMIQETIINRDGWRAGMKYLYDYSTLSRYIQEERLHLNINYEPYLNHQYTNVPFQVTINCSKPEIISGQTPKESHYNQFEGKCVICYENIASKSRSGLRAYEFTCNQSGAQFFRQFPPYPYFNGHNVIIDRRHVDQHLTIDTIKELLDICETMPGYKVASNSDRDGTGATNLLHRHYQAGDYHFAVFYAQTKKEYHHNDCTIRWLNYPSACLQIRGLQREQVENTSFKLFNAWRNGDFSPALQQPLQTCSFIATFDETEKMFHFLIFARNAQQPKFLTRPSLQCIKKEFVGIFEMCGRAILPGRLKDQLSRLESILIDFESNSNDDALDYGKIVLDQEHEIFRQWINDYYVQLKNLTTTTPTTTKQLLIESMNHTFIDILRDNSPIKENDFETIDKWIEIMKKDL